MQLPPTTLLFVVVATLSGSTVYCEDPAEVINRSIREQWRTTSVTAATDCKEPQFVRRLYLDLAGRIPTPNEVQSFINDDAPDKNVVLVDHILQSEDYFQHFADVFDTLLMGRTQPNQYDERQKHQWRSWLENIFRENQPWNDAVVAMLLARPNSQNDRGAVWFLYERNNDHQKIAEAIAPAIFGIRIECAQCHDHMIATEIKQAHYWGLVGFFNRSTNQKTPGGPRVAESAIGGFSEFANLEGTSTPNLLTFFGTGVVDEVRPSNDEQTEDRNELYVPASLENDPRVPAFSRREQFVEQVAKNHPLVARAFVNRVWAILLGRGIVHPFDEMDSVHEPSHPELLNWLAEDFRQSNYNIRRLIRSIVLSDPYGLDSLRPEGADNPATFAWYLERPLTAEQLARSIETSLRGISIRQPATLLESMRQNLPEVLPEESVTAIKHALFLSNNNALNQFISESQDRSHLIPQVLQLDSPEARTEQLFQAIFNRSPTIEEHHSIINYLGNDPSKHSKRLQQIAWSMLTSAEFRFNH